VSWRKPALEKKKGLVKAVTTYGTQTSVRKTGLSKKREGCFGEDRGRNFLEFYSVRRCGDGNVQGSSGEKNVELEQPCSKDQKDLQSGDASPKKNADFHPKGSNRG